MTELSNKYKYQNPMDFDHNVEILFNDEIHVIIIKAKQEADQKLTELDIYILPHYIHIALEIEKPKTVKKELKEDMEIEDADIEKHMLVETNDDELICDSIDLLEESGPAGIY